MMDEGFRNNQKAKQKEKYYLGFKNINSVDLLVLK